MILKKHKEGNKQRYRHTTQIITTTKSRLHYETLKPNNVLTSIQIQDTVAI